jgi:hypothetical protein
MSSLIGLVIFLLTVSALVAMFTGSFLTAAAILLTGAVVAVLALLTVNRKFGLYDAAE